MNDQYSLAKIPAKQLQLTNRLIEALTQLNLNTINTINLKCTHQNKDVITIAIHGLPPHQDQWKHFIFPGKFILYFPPGCENQGKDQYFQSRFQNFSILKIAKQIDELVQSNGGKKVVLVYHSFGTFAASFYTHYFAHKIIGIIQIGSFPIIGKVKFYQLYFQIEDQKFFTENIQLLYQKYLQTTKGKYQSIVAHKYQLLYMFLAMYHVKQKFLQIRKNLPKILKLLIFGRSDKIFQKQRLHYTAAYQAYENKIQSQQQNELRKLYFTLTGIQIQNAQQRFIFSYKKAGHSVHLIRKPQIQKSMNLYFNLVLRNIPQRSKL